MKINFKDIPGATRLFIDYLYDFEKVKEFYPCSPYDEKSYEGIFRAVSGRVYDRDLLVQVLKEQNQQFGNYEVTIASIDRLLKENSLVVFTGQQVGLFGGPLYTLYKAMTAINLARYLTMTTRYTFLPLFWIEGEDHDFEEIRRAFIVDKGNKLREITYDPKIPFAGQCVGGMVIDETINELIESFSDSVHDTDFKGKVIDSLKQCYHPGKTLAQAFGSWMAALLGQYGLILVDPSDERLKNAALPVYEISLEKHRDYINPALSRVSEELVRRGYHAQVGHRPDTLDFFYHDPRRLPFIRENDTYYLKNTDRHFSKADLQTFLRGNIKNFSPNVILRPQVQDGIFPTAAYVAGPSETAYFAQFSKLYEIFGTPMPIIYPRKSLTLVENRIDKILNKYGISFEDVFKNKSILERRIMQEQIPEEFRQEVEDTRREIFSRLDVLEKTGEKIDPNLKPVIRDLKGRIQKDLSHAEARIARTVEKKDQVVKEQLEKIFVNFFPDNHLQERRLNVLSFLYKYYQWFVYSLMELTCCKHESNHVIRKVEI